MKQNDKNPMDNVITISWSFIIVVKSCCYCC